MLHRLFDVALTSVACGVLLIVPSAATADPLGAGRVDSYHRMTVTGLGDSVPSGAECGCTSYVTLFGSMAAPSPPFTRVANLAGGGLTSAGLVAQLATPSVRAAVSRSDVVIVTVGANDFAEGALTLTGCQADGNLVCYRKGLTRLQANLAAALSSIDVLVAGRQAQVLITGYWAVFKDGHVAQARGSRYQVADRALTSAVNALVRAAAERYGAVYVDIQRPFNGDGTRDDTRLLAADGDHPNARGHALIADLLFAAWTPR